MHFYLTVLASDWNNFIDYISNASPWSRIILQLPCLLVCLHMTWISFIPVEDTQTSFRKMILGGCVQRIHENNHIRKVRNSSMELRKWRKRCEQSLPLKSPASDDLELQIAGYLWKPCLKWSRALDSWRNICFASIIFEESIAFYLLFRKETSPLMLFSKPYYLKEKWVSWKVIFIAMY